MAKRKDREEQESDVEETATETQEAPPEPAPKVDVTHISVNRAAFYRLVNALVKRQPEAYIGHAAIGKLAELLELKSYPDAVVEWQKIRDILG